MVFFQNWDTVLHRNYQLITKLWIFWFTFFIWLSNIGQSKNQMINEVIKLQRKAIRIITFNNQFALAEPLFKKLKILPFHKMIQMQNCHLVLSHLNNNLPGTFRDFFKYANNQHQYHTSEAYNNKITLPHVKTTWYSLQSIQSYQRLG